MKRLGWFVLLFVCLLMIAGYAVWVVRNPEREVLDDRARTAAPGAFATLPAGKVHYELAGPAGGRVAVLVHGFSVPGYIWEPTFRRLQREGFRVLRFDTFGRGWSDRPDAAYDGPFYSAQIDGLLAELGIRGPVDLLGLSFGGFIVAHYAATHPERIRTLTLVDPLTAGRKVPWRYALPGIGGWFYQVAVVPGLADNLMGDFLHPERFPRWADGYRTQMRYPGFGRALRRTMLAAERADFPALYREIERASYPVLLVWGREDAVLPLAGAERIRSVVTRTEFLVVDEAGHLPQMERPDVFEPRLLAFLRAVPTP
ncbi:MAG: alpha/beta fold hydrolase [Opitutaceae bacterium]